jgi:D-psicose/D-tagatose/L-ribulose 3-epimerase
MRISLCNEVIAELDIARQFEFALEHGYDGVEIAPFTLSDEPHRLPASRRAELRRLVADAGIGITSLHYLLRAPAGLSITAVDKRQRETTIEVMRALCGFAADLDAKVIVHGSPAQRRLDPGDEAEGRKRAIECWAAVADAAEQAGLAYCIEALSRHEANFVNTIAEAADIVRMIDSPAIRTMIDCSAAALTEKQSVPDLIRQWVPTGLIGHVHFNDPNRCGPGDGDLDFKPIVAALRETQYQGDSAIEPFIYEPDGPACAARGIAYMRSMLDRA